ncbi:phosphatase, partial [Streptomyces sp. SID10815]|nr:phosphatase [Streptomyces sp. SID10815]
MPVPVPRQRAIPAAESGPAQTVSHGAGGPAAAPAPQEATKDITKDITVEKDSRTVGHHAHGGGQLTLLLIEDDPGGSPIVPELTDSAGKPIRIRTARNLTEAGRLLTDDVHCILLDLALPAPGRAGEADDELAVLKHVLELAPRHAVLALTASGDAERGAEAVRVGAQDYLLRDELDGPLLSRAIRYAVERKRSDTAERRLAEGRLRAQENRRLERGLLPTPLLDGAALRFAARYRPGR